MGGTGKPLSPKIKTAIEEKSSIAGKARMLWVVGCYHKLQKS
jgi:hypothetical protein